MIHIFIYIIAVTKAPYVRSYIILAEPLQQAGMQMAASFCLLLGFPATYYIAAEVAEDFGKDEHTRKALEF